MTAAKQTKAAEADAKKAPQAKNKAFEEALAKLEALPHLNYTEAKDILVSVFRAL
jgi:hypothetical protein